MCYQIHSQSIEDQTFHPEIASLCPKFLIKSLEEVVKQELIVNYATLQNCVGSQSPVLNIEID